MHIINLYAKYMWIFKFGRILRSVLRSPDSRFNYPNPILRRISSLTTLASTVQMHWLLSNNPAGQTNDRDEKLKVINFLLLLHMVKLKALTMVEKGEKQK